MLKTRSCPNSEAGTAKRLKLLLIQPENPRIRTFRQGQLNNFVQLTIPYLAAYVNEKHYELTIVDEYSQKIPLNRPFDLVCFTVNTPNAPHCYALAGVLRKRGARVAFGGPHPTLLPQEAGHHCDYLLVGEGERTWPQFLNDFARGCAKPLYREQDAPCLRGLPPPRWDLLKGRANMMKGAVIATRGCPHNCRYCNLKQIYAPGFRTRPVDEVIREIKALPTRFFVFWDDNFFADKRHALQVMEALRPLKKRWAAQVTLQACKDEELLAAARRAGCIYLFVGLESFSPAALKDAGKGINRTKEYRQIIDTMHRYKILIQAGIVFGFDSDTPAVFARTLAAYETLGVDGVTVSILTPLPKTPIYKQMQEEGRLLTHNWERYDGKTSVTFRPQNMTPGQLYAGYMWFRRRFYSPVSMARRMWASKTRPVYNLGVNLGYGLALHKRPAHT